ncbi:conserved hypothetical protein DNA-binding protein jumonji/RBP2/SMCY, contains JmjC domain [Scheffersomyces stipitis CBS 6054]|uniref:Uncharacterized protein n=1 Tax=Scheffersomyces stipitis (strain ATCC 58785 / CBS 6054 / NBRC 10063 / NRRL Y-11545) TaxID=322104 RepID=A3LST7_PICST|nr:conserved hypothetical protein DNA-binding protein jumonji/RBP2/SMCY, contains JmjC domain [Scheffersomyces stipitis CBS 6054]ABN65950.2 conserved hypothetical protein DNA-binding protein jumonji/RBP2/SMCY, contains JmjC domain [Scheffersomyces stipitis CBS 6054]
MFDKSLLTPCPVLRPSEEEFGDPIGYLSRKDISALGAEYGIVKIVPPDSWKPPFMISDDFRFHTRLQKLSDLGLSTRCRKFFRDNINRFMKMRRKRPLRLYFRAIDPLVPTRFIKVYYYDLYVAVDNHGGYDKMTSESWSKVNSQFGVAADSNRIRDVYEANLLPYASYIDHNNFNYHFPQSDSEDEFDNCLICGKHDRPSRTLLCDNCDNPYHMDCLPTPLDDIPNGNWYCDKCVIGTGEYGFEEEVDVKYTIDEFENECEQFKQEFEEKYNRGEPLTVDTIEKRFWDFVEAQNSEIQVKYGADIHNLVPGQISGFPMENTPGINAKDSESQNYINHPFNLTRLPFAKGSLLNYINTSISGMTVPWIYVGSLLSTFCWHVEDHYTLSANYCHMGATKKWYGIPSSQANQFEKLMRESAPDLFKRQPDLLHQLVTLMSPMKLVENGIRCVYADQNPREMVITYPRVYHAGFNCGFNFNEAVNFTMNCWLEFGERSINDYSLIGKENVFNHYKLIENILKAFNKQRGSISREEIDVVKRSLLSFESYILKQNDLLSQIDKTKLVQEYIPKKFSPRKFEEEQAGIYSTDGDDEEDLCDLCKTHLSYQYCIVNNRNHNVPTVAATSSPSIAPASTTVIKQEPTEIRRITIQQLLTPDSSPYESKKTFEESTVDVGKLATSEAALSMSKLNETKTAETGDDEDDESKLCMMEQFDELINNAKRAASEELQNTESGQKRRHSRRLQELPKVQEIKKEKEGVQTVAKRRSSRPTGKMTGKMMAVQQRSEIKQLNEKDTIRLCLSCFIKTYENSDGKVPVPEESILHFESYPSQLKELVKSTKRNINELFL